MKQLSFTEVACNHEYSRIILRDKCFGTPNKKPPHLERISIITGEDLFYQTAADDTSHASYIMCRVVDDRLGALSIQFRNCFLLV